MLAPLSRIALMMSTSGPEAQPLRLKSNANFHKVCLKKTEDRRHIVKNTQRNQSRNINNIIIQKYMAEGTNMLIAEETNMLVVEKL